MGRVDDEVVSLLPQCWRVAWPSNQHTRAGGAGALQRLREHFRHQAFLRVQGKGISPQRSPADEVLFRANRALSYSNLPAGIPGFLVALIKTYRSFPAVLKKLELAMRKAGRATE